MEIDNVTSFADIVFCHFRYRAVPTGSLVELPWATLAVAILRCHSGRRYIHRLFLGEGGREMSDLVKGVALLCLTILAVTAACAFPEPTSKVIFVSILSVIGAIIGVPVLVAKLRRRKDG